jgi:two-component system sensor histidine kinase FlrB
MTNALAMEQMQTITPYESNLVPLPLLQGAEGTLSEGFSSFISAANVLERSYRSLQEEVGRLRLELQESHADLARSLREKEQMRTYLSCIVESLPCGVMVLDDTGRARMSNQEANKLLPENTAQSLKILAEAVRQKIMAELDYEITGSEGQRCISIKRAPLASGESAKDESVVIVRDVTDHRKMERERENNRRMQALAEISAVLAHEIRNPLASMELFASLLADVLVEGSEELEWTQQMQAGLRLLSATVNNVLQFYSEAPSRLFSLDLHSLIHATVATLKPVARHHGIEIRFDSNVKHIYVNGDNHKLQQVFFNLAVNAFRAMQPGQTLSLILRRKKDCWAHLQFCDEGCGIAAEDLDSIFQPGFTGGANGPGLGLAVCQRIMDQHAGTITVLSAPGAGSTFTLRFPALGECQ